MERSPARPPALLALAAATTLLGACRDGGKPDYGVLLTIDEALVVDRLERLEAVVPACRTTDAATRRRAQRMAVAGTGASGSCGGTLDVQTDHADGDTAYDLLFAGFCMSGTEAGDVVVDGAVAGEELGTPSDAGPTIEAFTLETSGPLAVDHDGADLEVELEGARTDYGLPAAWGPQTATAAQPDVTEVELITVHLPNGEEADVLLGELRIERVGTVPELTITDGMLALRGEGHVNLSTRPSEPFTFGGVDSVSGALVLTGAEDTELVLRPADGTLLAMELELNGQPMAQGMDCSATLPQFLQAAVAVLGALPVY